MTRWGWGWLLLPPLLFGLMALFGCAALPQKTPEQLAATLPADLVAIKRKDLANGMMTGFLAYQFLRPYAEAACRPTTPGGPLPSQECYELATLDPQLKGVWDQFWTAIFDWIPGAGTPQIDWGKILGTLLDLLLKVAGKVVLGVRPGLLPPGTVPGVPQLAPRIPSSGSPPSPPPTWDARWMIQAFAVSDR